MDRTRVEAGLIEIHKRVQARLNDAGAKVTSSTCPLSDLKGFESVMIPTIVFEVADHLGIDISEDTKIKNIYVSKDGRQRLTIGEIAGRFCDVFAKEVAKA